MNAQPEDIMKILLHWRKVRDEKDLNQDEIDENLRCSVDLLELYNKISEKPIKNIHLI